MCGEIDTVIVFPILNDWKALKVLLASLDEQFSHRKERPMVVIAEDGGSEDVQKEFEGVSFKAIKKIRVLRLVRNFGHQRAIAIALSHIAECIPCKVSIVMYGDGEDSPNDVFCLIDKCTKEDNKKIIFAKRAKRSENLQFRSLYEVYQLIFAVLTGSHLRYGNFSIIPYRLLLRVVLISEIWNHFSSAVVKAKIPHGEVPLIRAHRLAGFSKMTFTSLIYHGMSAISVYADIIGVRIFLGTLVPLVLSLLAIFFIFWVRLFHQYDLPGWASVMVLGIFLNFVQIASVALLFMFLMLLQRNQQGVIPKKDYHCYIYSVRELFESNTV